MFKACLGKRLIGAEEKNYLSEVITSQTLFRFNLGETSFCHRAENRLKEILGIKHCLVITNCTNAIKSALIALEPTPGDYVLIPAISFIATASACLSVGLIPIMIDVDESGHLDPEALADFLQTHPKPFAVIAVHLDGAGCQIEKIVSICKQAKLPLIEDTARSLSVTREGKCLGTFGDIGCFSFQENKILSTGEGGAIVTQDSALFEKIAAYSDHGAKRDVDGYPNWDQNLGFGENFKSDELTAAVLFAQLEKLEYIQRALQKHSQLLTLNLPKGSVYPRHVEDIPTVVWIDSLELQEEMKKTNIPLISWKNWFLPDHPIIREKRSFYRNNYPWNLSKIENPPHSDNARRIAYSQKIFPSPLKKKILSSYKAPFLTC